MNRMETRLVVNDKTVVKLIDTSFKLVVVILVIWKILSL